MTIEYMGIDVSASAHNSYGLRDVGLRVSRALLGLRVSRAVVGQG